MTKKQESLRMLHPSYPALSVNLGDGRIAHVHMLFWEPTYSEVLACEGFEQSSEVEIHRKRLQIDELIGHRKKHFIGPRLVNQFQADPPRIPNTAISVWLSSEPIDRNALYSECIVVFFCDFVPNVSLDAMLETGLEGFDWERHAVDITAEMNDREHVGLVDQTVH